MARSLPVRSARRAGAALFGLVLAGCATPAAHTRPGSGALVHVVAFWLEPDAPADMTARMRDFYLARVVRNVPGVQAAWIGTPRRSDRDVVDDSFSCMSVVRFASAADEARWQAHPVHDELKRMFEPHLRRVVVYDFVE